jgi:hypothetical protein
MATPCKSTAILSLFYYSDKAALKMFTGGDIFLLI